MNIKRFLEDNSACSSLIDSCLRVAWPVVILTMLCAATARSEMVLVPATEMVGIEGWKAGQSWGAGDFFSSNGTPVTKRVTFQGGAYEVYARVYSSPSAPADIRIWVNDHCLVAPMQAKVVRFGWLRVASIILPEGETEIRAESPTFGKASNHSFAALAFCSTTMDDRVGRIIAFTEWLRHELARLEMAKPGPRSAAEMRQRQQTLREDLLDALGLDPLPPRTPLKPKIHGSIEKKDYVIEKITYESRPNHVVPALLYLPKNASGPVPAVISAIGHWSYGKSSEKPQLRGIGLAKHGYALLAIEAVGAWERRIPGNREGFEPFVAGGCIAGHEVWDIMRGADYLESRLDVDATRLAVTGASGGGLQTFYAGAVDERFDAVMPSVALWPMSELALNFFYSTDNWVPGISQMGGMSSLIAITAPRPMLVMNVDEDYATSYACEQMVNVARPFYRVQGVESRIQHTIERGVHDYTELMRENTYGFVDRWLKGTGDGFPVDEPPLDSELFAEDDRALLVFGGKGIPEEDAETVQSIWTARAAKLRADLPETPTELPEKIRALLRMPNLPPPEAVPTDRGFLLTTDPGVQVPVLRTGTGPRAVIWLGESDFETESRRNEVQALAQHASVFVVEPRGASMSAEMHILRHAPIVMGRPLVGMWTYDLLCVVDFLERQQEFDHVFVAGNGGEMGLACLLASVLDERIQGAAINQLFSSFVQLVGSGNPNPQIPGVLKVADVEHLVRSAGLDRVRLNNVKKSPWAGTLRSSRQPAVTFFEEWLESASK
ncbi:MAG: prolyl oligopeptidase family serine peptidase [Planctomycetaceae bacterium]